MYVFYGVEIPKDWLYWNATGIENGHWDVDIPEKGGEPVTEYGVPIRVCGFELTLYKYPLEQQECKWQPNSGIIGFNICEIDEYSNPEYSIKRYNFWKTQDQQTFNSTLKNVCETFRIEYTTPKMWTCTTE